MASHAALKSRGISRPRRASVLIYSILAMVALAGLLSFAVDLGAVQLAKTQLQRAADATAHDYILLYNQNGKTYANTNGPNSYNPGSNPVNLVSGAQPTYTITWGYWNTTTKSFSTGNNGGNVAIKVVGSCTNANGNAVPLLFGAVVGAKSIDITATAIAISVSGSTKTITLDAQSNPYFSGMPSDTMSMNGDNAVDNAPTQVNGIPVVPGSILTFTSMSGTSSVVPGTMGYFGPEGATGTYGTATHHGVSWDGSGTARSENGIADAVMPESSVMGLFLNDSAPDTSGAPATVDWTSSAYKDKATYSNLQLKAPFYIGNGATTTGTVQQFTVPAGATRFFLGIWDGVQYNNNAGSISLTITTTAKLVQLVK